MFKIKNKKFFKYFLTLILIFVVILLFFLYFRNKISLKNRNIIINNDKKNLQNISKNLPAVPNFLSSIEKKNLGVSSNLKIQALKRNSKGEIMIYKIIKKDSDIVSDPSTLSAIEPSLPKSNK